MSAFNDQELVALFSLLKKKKTTDKWIVYINVKVVNKEWAIHQFT